MALALQWLGRPERRIEMARFASLPEPVNGAASVARVAAPQRARGRADLAFRSRDAGTDGEVTELSVLYQQGCAKIRLPGRELGAPAEAVFINTAGGLTDGDRLALSVSIGPDARAVVTTQSAERIYRAAGPEPAHVDVTLAVGRGARLDWLPQETILFDRSALSRTLAIDLAADASLLAVESFVFGRSAMGETVRAISLRDSWRVRRAGRLIFADGLRLDGDAGSILAGPATASGATACATLLYVTTDAPDRLDALRAALSGATAQTGVTAWNGMLLARFLAPSSQALRRDLGAALSALRGDPLPRVWMC